MNSIKRLIFDADDTLWDNNIYYEIATEEFIQLAITAGISGKRAQRDFDEQETQVVKKNGYGSKSFLLILENLFQSYEALRQNSDYRKIYLIIISEFKKHLEQPLAIFPHVIPTLKQLSHSYDLFILTKGNLREQRQKLHKFELLSIFQESFVVLEKNIHTYQSILREKQWNAEEICMIGNSPKSDINPALRVGMYAVFIPYPYTWKLDDEPILQKHARLFTLRKFSELLPLFKSGEKGNQP